MDTMELMNQETIEAITDTATSVGEVVSNAVSSIAENAPEIRYVEVPVEGSGSIGSFVLGLATAGITAGAVWGIKKVKKIYDEKKKKTEESAKDENSGSLEGYERKTEQKPEAEKNDQNPEAKVETVTGEVVTDTKSKK